MKRTLVAVLTIVSINLVLAQGSALSTARAIQHAYWPLAREYQELAVRDAVSQALGYRASGGFYIVLGSAGTAFAVLGQFPCQAAMRAPWNRDVLIHPKCEFRVWLPDGVGKPAQIQSIEMTTRHGKTVWKKTGNGSVWTGYQQDRYGNERPVAEVAVGKERRP